MAEEKAKSRFFCDSNCEIWFNRFDELSVSLIKMPYTVDGEEFMYDLGRETDCRGFFDKMRKGAYVKTQALNQLDYIDYFEPVLKNGEDIIYVTFSQAMSGTFNSMNIALSELREKYPERKVTVADTGGISMGAGMAVYYAAKMHNEGASDEEVADFVGSFKKRISCYFTVDDLKYLKRGGRLSAFKAAMGTIFNMKPIISMMDDGTLSNIATEKGRKKALKALVAYMERDGVDESYPAVIMNADCDADAALTIEMIKEKYPGITVWEQLVGPVVGSHCGPDTIGLIFVRKEKD